MVDKVDTKERGRRVLSAPGKPKVGSRVYKDWLAGFMVKDWAYHDAFENAKDQFTKEFEKQLAD